MALFTKQCLDTMICHFYLFTFKGELIKTTYVIFGENQFILKYTFHIQILQCACFNRTYYTWLYDKWV